MAKTDLFDRFSRHSPQAAVVSGPVAAVPQLRAGQPLGAGQQGLPRLFRQGLQLPGEELPHPGAGKLSRRLHRRGRRGGLILPATKKAGRRPLGWRPCLCLCCTRRGCVAAPWPRSAALPRFAFLCHKVHPKAFLLLQLPHLQARRGAQPPHFFAAVNPHVSMPA